MNKLFFLFFLLFTLSNFIYLSADSYISYLEGSVTVTRGSETIRGDFGLPLLKNDTIETGHNSLAVLEVEGRGILKMKDDTIMSLDNLGKKLEVSLKSGGLFSKIKKILGLEYEVRTMDTIAGVRGTQFFIAFGKTIESTPDLWLCVNEGTVEVSITESNLSVLVEEGEGITIPAGNRLTDPRFYKWTEKLNWNYDPLQGELVDKTDLNGAYEDLRNFDYD